MLNAEMLAAHGSDEAGHAEVAELAPDPHHPQIDAAVPGIVRDPTQLAADVVARDDLAAAAGQ
jgi:hypothetical protein